MVKVFNGLLSFMLELAMLAAFAFSGFHWSEGRIVPYLLGLGIPLLVILFWSKWMAPKSAGQLPFLWLLVVTFLLFESAAFSLYLVKLPNLALVFALLALLNVSIRIVTRSHRSKDVGQ